MTSQTKSVLFVCLGNICRSPIAEAVLKHLLKERDLSNTWHVDSAATADYHVGKQPDIRARKCMQKHGIEISHRARCIFEEDFRSFDFIFGMDESNIRDLKGMAPDGTSGKIHLLGEYDPEGKKIIRDPYYDDGSDGFEEVYEQCVRCCKGFLSKEA